MPKGGYSCCWLVGAVFYFVLKDINGLKSMLLHVPEVVKSGETVTLSCEYDLEQADLYTIKWYWNDEEFYRFVPKESPPFRAYSVQFINVDILKSNNSSVTLRGVRRELSGVYKCEVSADAPLFHTDIKKAYMIVAELPNGNPVMNIEPEKVEIGKRIRADCYSPGSDPAANLTWFINDEMITDDNFMVDITPPEINTDKALGLHSTKSKIEIITNRSHFLLGLMALKCEASIYSLWNQSVEHFVRDATPHLAPVLGPTSSQSHSDELPDLFLSSSFTPRVYFNCNMFLLLVLLISFLFR